MGLFNDPKLRPATSFFKISIYGQQGAGKTYTAAELAAGIAEVVRARDGKCGPVCMIESETGSPKIAHLFAKRNIEFLPISTRSYKDLRDGIREAVAMSACALIVDSVTHYSENLMESFLRAKKKDRLALWDYGPIGELWKPFTEDFLNSPIHFISCGRLAWNYETVETGEGSDVHRETIKSSSKLRALKDFGYEADILIEMEFVQDRSQVGRKTRKAGEKVHVETQHVGYVMKDRWSQLEGKLLVNPTFKDFEPVWNLLSAPSAHRGIAVRETPVDVARNWDEFKQRKQIAWEEIKGTLDHHFPGSSERQMKNVLLCAVFGTFSDTKIQDMHVDRLEEGFKVMSQLCPLAIAENAPALLADKSGTEMRVWHDKKIGEIRKGLSQVDDTNPFGETGLTPGEAPSLFPPSVGNGKDEKRQSWKDLHADLVTFIRPKLLESDRCETIFEQLKTERKVQSVVVLNDVLNRKKPAEVDVRLLQELKQRLEVPR